MIYKINFQKYSLFIFWISVLAFNFTSLWVYSGVIFLLVLITIIIEGKVDLYFIRIVMPLLLFAFVGTINLGGHELKDIVRDFLYAIFPICFLFFGDVIARHKIRISSLGNAIIIAASLTAVIHLSELISIFNKTNKDAVGFMQPEHLTGDIVVIGLILLIYRRQFNITVVKLGFLKLNSILLILLLVFSLFFSYSRTLWMLFLMLIIPFLMNGHFKIKIFTGCFLIVSTFMIYFLGNGGDLPENLTFINKVLRSFTEISISDYQDFDEISYNWRGFETYRALQTWLSGGWKSILIGQGFGALADLGMTMELAGLPYEAIPVLHNGYAYVLLKGGLMGLACYVFFYISAWRCRKSNSSQFHSKSIDLLNRMKIGILLALITSMYVVGGIAEVHSAEFILLLGFILRRIRDKTIDRFKV